ncbi:MAG: hypothetical protein PHQ04_03995 [Opitutaceae bacterium]|nr:hypothetical protein [Opitutaceae bacterium]
MKRILSHLLLLHFTFTAAQAMAVVQSSSSTQSISITDGRYDLNFGVNWTCDDSPQNSAPGRVELLDGAGNVLGRVVASDYQGSGPQVSANLGSVDSVASTIAIYAANRSPADGDLSATWHIAGVADGAYTLRFWNYRTDEQRLNATTVWTMTSSLGGSSPPPVNQAPTIAWTSASASAGSGQPYTISAHGHDDDGNLTQVNIWKNGQPFAFAGGGNGIDGDSSNPTSDMEPQTVTFTAQAFDAAGAASAVITQTVTITAANHPPTISWNITPGVVGSGQIYTVSAHGHDEDGNLTQVNVWKNGQPFAFGGGGNGTDNDSGNPTSDTGPQTITFTAQAVDAAGAASATISQTVTIAAPPPSQYTLTTGAGTGGSVSAGGTFNAGTVVTVTAIPDAIHDFSGWTGDAVGSANPVLVTLDRNKSVVANFSLTVFALTTSATTGGSITPGGSYPCGTTVTLAALPDATHLFLGWAGDASGTSPAVAVTMNSPKSVQAVFTAKAAQSISFPPLPNQSVGATYALSANASSGLPVSYAVLGGSATVNGSQLQVTGPGAITVQASQSGDAIYLPASSVAQTFNAAASAALRYRPAGRTLLQDSNATGAAPFVLEKP